MPIEQMRILSLMVVGASVMAYLSGDFRLGLFSIQMMAIAPLWFPIDLDKVRKLPFWKVYGFITFVFFILSSFRWAWPSFYWFCSV